MITRILLDLDDVLNDFTMSTLRRLGCDLDSYDPAWGWDIVRAANSSHPLRQFTPETFWDSLDRTHWASRPKSDLCDWLVGVCGDIVGKDNVYIVTSPTKDPDCLAGKLEWIHTHLPKWLHRQYAVTPRKHLCANPSTLLIDDCDANCEAFASGGGTEIVVPRPWNGLYRRTDAARWHVSHCLGFYFQERVECLD